MKTYSYYRSTHPTIAEFSERQKAAAIEYMEQVTALKAEYPDHNVNECSFPAWGILADVVGLLGETSPGPLWRQSGEVNQWVPNRRSKAGRELDDRLNMLRLRRLRIPGMPGHYTQGRSRYVCSFEHMEGAYWVHWAVPAENLEQHDMFDPALWTRVKASEYYLAQEAQAEAEEGRKVVRPTFHTLLRFVENAHSRHIEQEPPGLNLRVRCVECGETSLSPEELIHADTCWLREAQELIQSAANRFQASHG